MSARFSNQRIKNELEDDNKTVDKRHKQTLILSIQINNVWQYQLNDRGVKDNLSSQQQGGEKRTQIPFRVII